MAPTAWQCRGDWLAITGAWIFLLIFTASGCASLKKQQVVPDSVSTCRQLSREGAAAMERNQWGEARALLEQAVEASPSDLDSRRQLAEALWRLGSVQEAAVHMEAAVRLDPQHVPTLVRSGEMLLGLGAVERALARAEEAIALDSAQAGAWVLRGRVFRRQGDRDRALADLHQSLRYNPRAVDVLIDVAELQYQLERPQRCLTTVQQALGASAPGQESRRALWVAGLAYSALNRPGDAAAALYAASLQGQPHPELLYELARAQRASGHPDEAVATARQALAANGGHEPSRALLAQLEGGGAAGVDVPLRR